MAVVWNAEHTETGREVALKVVRPELAAHDSVREMFVREARVAARVGKNEHIVDVLDAGVDPELGLPFMAMELLAGEALDQRLQRAGALPAGEVRVLLSQLAEALDQAHAAGVIHRDLKPQNLFLTQTRKGDACLKVLDFGIAKAAETVQSSATQVGTPAYSAPEQLGATWRTIAERNGRVVTAQVSPATDVWALGLIAYELLSGAPSGQFWGASSLAELPAKIFLEPLPSAVARAPTPANLPADFDAWLARCLDLNAQQRFPSAGAAVAALFGDAPAAPREASAVYAPPPAPLPGAYGAPPAPAYGAPPPDGYVPPPTAHPSVPPGAGAVPGAATTGGGFASATLTAWANERGMQIREGGDVHAYATWMQFQFVPPIASIVREGKLSMGDAEVLIGEAVIHDEIRRAIGEAHMLVALVYCPRIRHSVSLRTKKLTGVTDGVQRGLRALEGLMSSKPKETSVLGDQWFEQHFEVRGPSPQEAHHALPAAARLLLVNGGFTGMLETIPTRLTLAQQPARFDPQTVDRTLDFLSRLLATYG